jgi:rare lipoprotein A
MKILLSIILLLMLNVQIYADFEIGKASWYSIYCNGGTHTASGQKLNNHSNTAAHRTLPFGSIVKVTNLRNGKYEIVVINNRGPFIKGRIIDVTVGVAEKLGFRNQGITNVKLEVLNKGKVKGK